MAEPTAPDVTLTHVPTFIEAWRTRRKPQVFPTGYPALTSALGGGLRSGQLTVCTAMPGAGKTSVTIAAIAIPTAARGQPVLYVSAELDSDYVVARAAGMRLRTTWVNVIDGALPDDVIEGVLGGPLHVLGPDAAHQWPSAIDCVTRECGTPPLVIIDYVQLLAMHRTMAGVQPRQALNLVLQDLRREARARHVPIWCVSATSRSFYNVESQATTDYLGSGRESSDLEFLASTVLHLRPLRVRTNGLTPLEVHIPKGRLSGIAGLVMYFNGATGELFASNESIDGARACDLAAEVFEIVAQNRARYTSAEQIGRDLGRPAGVVRRVLHELEERGAPHGLRLVPGPPGRNGEPSTRRAWDIFPPNMATPNPPLVVPTGLDDEDLTGSEDPGM